MTAAGGSGRAAMLASYVLGSGSSSDLQFGELPRPVPAGDQVLIRVRAASLDRVDSYLRRGTHGMATTGPTVLGRDMCGTVVDVGDEVTTAAVGDEVIALGSGTHAEYAIAPARHVLPRPPGWTDAQAAALPTAGRTAYDAVANLAAVRPGETVLVIAAAGAVGTFAVQYAGRLGARVLATAGSAEKRAAVSALGAQAAFDHYAPEVTRHIRDHLGGAGVDVVIESVGGRLWEDLQRLLAPRARMITCGVTADAHARIHLGRLMTGGWTIRGIGRPGPAEIARHLDECLALSAAAGPPVVDSTFALADAAAAHAKLESSDFVGRIVLRP